MNRIKSRLKQNKGETLVEVLCSMLIVVLVSALLAFVIASCVRINKLADKSDQEYRDAIDKAAEMNEKQGTGTLVFKDSSGSSVSVDVDYYGTEDLVSIREK